MVRTKDLKKEMIPFPVATLDSFQLALVVRDYPSFEPTKRPVGPCLGLLDRASFQVLKNNKK